MKFISMQYVEGGDLLQLLQREGPLPVSRAVPIMVQLCEALQAAQAANVIHRDLKPQNIPAWRRRPHFRVGFRSCEIHRSVAWTGVTRDGAILGTQNTCRRNRCRASRWISARIFIRSASSFTKFLPESFLSRGNSTYELMYQRVHELPRRPEEFNPQIPAYLSAIVLRCLEKGSESSLSE